jgi:hypothetical protein
MISIQQWQSERAGLNAAEINRDKAESGSAHGSQHLGPEWINHGPRQLLRRQLDTRHLIVVTHSEIGESQLPQG